MRRGGSGWNKGGLDGGSDDGGDQWMERGRFGQ